MLSIQELGKTESIFIANVKFAINYHACIPTSPSTSPDLSHTKNRQVQKGFASGNHKIDQDPNVGQKVNMLQTFLFFRKKIIWS
uniref:Uncharacterized protein n=1 Tax=Rhizophora mucronata TaxID=61149 RepID=A0A2P2Q9T4_RHIMU